jgi:alpha-mannosidase
MALSNEWKNRIDRWEKVLWKLCYQPLDNVAFEGFTTFDQLTAQQAQQNQFRPMPPGTRWGAKWEYGWFRTQVILPDAAARRRVMLRPALGVSEFEFDDCESLAWVNGKITSSTGWARPDISLTVNGAPGARFQILLETYSGHGLLNVGEGPVPYGSVSVPEPGPTQVSIGMSTFGVWRDDIYHLALDFTTLFELRNGLDERSMRCDEIDQGLMDATLIFDPELAESELQETARAARQRLQPLLACVNGSTAPMFYAIGHAHLDVSWLWPMAETERKFARTVANQLALFEEYPEHRFLQSQPHLYWLLKQKYPELYEEFKQAVLAGKVIPDGGMWLEADTNITAGESLIRQILNGKRFFKEEFGVDSRIMWLPDVFGYSGALPQILRGCGMIGFTTSKIAWRYNGGDAFPYNTFLWEGIDGTTIPTHIYTDYNRETRPRSLLELWNTRLQSHGVKSMILAYGWGDGGGGPTRDHLEFLRRVHDLEGLPRVRIASPEEFFTDLERQGLPKERYMGELYFQAHRGTYTSQAKTKQGNRRSELALREAELWGAAAQALNGFAFNARTLDNTWRKVLLCQFHDILPGSSIHRVHEEAEKALAEAVATASETARKAAATFTDGSPALTVFNSLSWPRMALVDLPTGPVEVSVPACGWKTIPAEQSDSAGSQVKAKAQSLENEYLRVEINPRGEIASLWDKEAGRELMAAPGNRLCLYKDVPDMWDAWDIDSMAEQQPVVIDEPVTIEVLNQGPLIGQIRLSRQLAASSLTQVISLRRDSRCIEFATNVDWRESHRLLKVAFPVNIHTNEGLHEIQFGHLRRPNHRSRLYDADRFEVCNQKWSALVEENAGVAVLNDCKYGLSVTGNSLNLTLLKSATAPDMTADKGLQTFTYALYTWNGSLAESGVVRAAYELNVPVMVIPGALGERSLFNLDAANIVIEAVKPAEDGSGDVVLRLYESMRTHTRCKLSTSLPLTSAAQTNMLEQEDRQLVVKDGIISLDFRPFEIKTVRLTLLNSSCQD